MKKIICFIFGHNYENVLEVYMSNNYSGKFGNYIHDFSCKRCGKSMSA